MSQDKDIWELDSEQHKFARFYQTAFSWTKRAGRHFGITSSGRFVMVPGLTKVGDSIGLLDGYLCGVVLREIYVEDTLAWQMVGDAFIEGSLGCGYWVDKDVDLDDILLV
jgi:hypothetical protein